jgi:hypothetical protein
MFQTKRQAEIELNFFEYSDSKRYFAKPDVVKNNKKNKPQYDLILGCPKPKASKDYLNSVSGHETRTRLVEAYKY